MGINQVIMMALALVVLACFIGAEGIGGQVWLAIRNLDVGWAMEGGLGARGWGQGVRADGRDNRLGGAERAAWAADVLGLVGRWRSMSRKWRVLEPFS